jgi:ADP-ribosylglycohydrolase
MEHYTLKDKIRGCLMAGAAGDALGYEVEFMSRKAILSRYGERGVTKFELDANGKALISDDTQMTLFTANGLLNANPQSMQPQFAVARAYVDWYYTQMGTNKTKSKSCWLRDIDELYSLRAPGNTCISALAAIVRGREPLNNSKGCGGVMRVAPVGLLAASQLFHNHEWKDGDVIFLGAECAKITHEHPAGWLSAGLLAHIIYEIVVRSRTKLIDRVEFEHIVGTACHHMITYFNELQECTHQLHAMMNKALELANQEILDHEAISQLGEGWVGDEALAIAIYCASRHIDSIEDAIIASVNHDGDSDSTGSICGNIMGAIHGYEHMAKRNIFCPEGGDLKDTLELSEIILAIADDLSDSCTISEHNPKDTPKMRQWHERYRKMKPAGTNYNKSHK